MITAVPPLRSAIVAYPTGPWWYSAAVTRCVCGRSSRIVCVHTPIASITELSMVPSPKAWRRTPLGRPVVPPVYIIMAPGATSSARAGALRPTAMSSSTLTAHGRVSAPSTIHWRTLDRSTISSTSGRWLSLTNAATASELSRT